MADNKLAELAGWDRDILAIELQNLLDSDLDFDVSDIGFETTEVDLMLAGEEPAGPDPADSVSEVSPGPPITQLGELWLLGRHRLLCADATQSESYDCLMGQDRAQLVFTDPPYNVRIDGHVSGLGKAHHPEFVMASGEMSEPEFTRFLEKTMSLMALFSTDGSIHFVCMDWRHLLDLLQAGRAAYSELKNICVWAKANGGMGSLYRSQHELVAVFKNGKAPHINNVELGKNGRYRTNVWSYAGMNSFQAGRDEALAMHPTVKPVALIADAILDCSKRKGIVLDPFGGSGTSLIAAERTGRRCFMMELDPGYVDVALRRFRSFTGIEPTCARTGVSFSDAESRAVQERNDTTGSKYNAR